MGTLNMDIEVINKLHSKSETQHSLANRVSRGNRVSLQVRGRYARLSCQVIIFYSFYVFFFCNQYRSKGTMLSIFCAI